MDGDSVIMVGGGSGNGQQWCNGQQDGGVIAMGDGLGAAQWVAQWVADNHCRCRSSTMGGDARWTAVAILMDGSSVIAMDGGSGKEQLRRNGRGSGEAITMCNGSAVVQWTAQ